MGLTGYCQINTLITSYTQEIMWKPIKYKLNCILCVDLLKISIENMKICIICAKYKMILKNVLKFYIIMLYNDDIKSIQSEINDGKVF